MSDPLQNAVDALQEVLAQRDARIAELEAAMKAVIQTDDYMVIGKKAGLDRGPSKHDECIHGMPRYNGCENCICEYLLRALKSEEGKVMDWNPIETAPKDGTYFVGWWYCEHSDTVFEANETHVVWWDTRLEKWYYYTGRTLLTATPTLWLQLPSFQLANPLLKPPTPTQDTDTQGDNT